MNNRLIKFRVWKPFNIGGEMIYSSIDYDKRHFGLFFYDDGCGWQDNNYQWMQFTGLIDFNGKEIYEGDIVKWTHPMEDIGEVKYLINDDFVINQCYYGLFIKRNRLGYCQFQSDDTYEVIGNIFENKGLLE